MSSADEEWLRLHQLAAGEFDFRIRQILPEYWDASTPCAEWDVHQLVNHNVVENLWVPPVLSGHPIDDVGGLDGDVLGADPELVWEDSWRDAVAAFAEADLAGVVTLSMGRTTVIEYLRQRTADLVVHAWDLATTIGVDDELDIEVVAAVYDWALPHAGAFADMPQLFEPPIAPPAGASAQSRLLHLFGREL